MLLILDLDETLIHAATTDLGRPADFRVGEYHVYQRPGLAAFLASVQATFDTAVWSSSTASYGRDVVAAIFPDPSGLKFVWTRERCVYRRDLETGESVWIKDLKKVKRLGYPLEQVLIVDDSPEKLTRNYGNHVSIRPFEGARNDDELRLLAAYLAGIVTCDNVRSLDKRKWRQITLASMCDEPRRSDGDTGGRTE
jgi:carboxy-terminal domain RNA polymerase II polypeptide A small phosphatase